MSAPNIFIPRVFWVTDRISAFTESTFAFIESILSIMILFVTILSLLLNGMAVCELTGELNMQKVNKLSIKTSLYEKIRCPT